MDLEKEESIDLGKLWQVTKAHKKVVGGIIVGCTAIATITAFVLPKQYESTTLVQTRNASKEMGGQAAAAMAALGVGGAASSPTNNYMELMKSRTVLDPIIDSMDWKDPDKKPDAKEFAKSNLDIKNTKGTNLIEVTAKGKTPEEAQQISQEVVDNFLKMQTDNSQQTQSLLVQFLNGRIEEAKKDSDDAAQKFADFSREHKLYSPDDQLKQAITQVSAYDKSLADLQSQQKAAQAQYDVATNKLGQQKSSSKAYNINDNGTVQSIRGQIVAKEVELVGLRQKYTDNNPTVIAAQQQLNQLQSDLASEVSAVVDSNAASLNSAQMELLKNQAVAEASASAAKASEDAVRAKKAEIEQDIDKYPDDMVTYLQLKSDAEIKKTIYTNLVQQCEQNKIQEAMESMDIQVIDEANLPDEKKPSAPKKKLIAAIGLALGCIIAFGYSLVMYKREA
ncbi:GNVR domain-containing protein [Mitsuokella multacida]|uniref:GumC family protein n=1 Tax=Mitsuokella multacida TaxID=52226 RepID=UPI0022E1EE3F|nr:GNVR domain-containing protein [Mitsuokella multacida]